jgi:hypothetical protein
LKLQYYLHRFSKRILSIFLLFLFLNIFSQQIYVDNKNNFPVEIRYKNHNIILNGGEKKIISDKEINYLTIEYNNGNNISKYIPLFLNSNESLKISIDNYDKEVEFKGNRDALHNLIINQQHYILYKNVVRYQDIYKKKNTKELINFSELVLVDYLDKIKSLNTSPLGKEDETYKRIEKYVINDWVASLYLFLTGKKTLDLQSKELILYYYNRYIKKDIENYSCEYKVQYNIISELARYINQINITLPKYTIIESTEDNSINQYLPKSCQRYYFINNFNYFNHINSQKKEYYKNVLKEKFNN